MPYHDLVCSEKVAYGSQQFRVNVYRGARKHGRVLHTAETTLAPGDSIVSDGYSVDEVLANLKMILPLALHSRLLLRELEGIS